jgi:histidinol-phosphate aminotransferase
MEPYVPGRPISDVKKFYNLTNVTKLASNENPYGCSPRVIEAVVETFKESSVYPDGYCTGLREAVSSFYKVNPANLIFGAGTDEVIAMLGKIFIEPGDEAITGAVTFSQYAAAVEAMDGRMKYARLSSDTYDLDNILACISPKTKMIFIANPNNPTGTYFSKEKQAAFMEKVPSNIVVVFDEAYEEYVTAKDYPNTQETMEKYPNALLLKTFSKIYGLASFRVGFGICHASIVRQMEKIRCPFNVSNQAQAAAIAALNDREFVASSRKSNKKVMNFTVSALEQMGLYVIPSETNFIMVDVKQNSREVFEKLMARGYIIRAGAAFGMDKHIRITIGSREEMEGFIPALKEVLDL